MAELLDLVCGPASPLPETHQRYRLVAHIASGGQAEVYRAVRLSNGVSSAPLTVKVFRLDDSRPRAEQLMSWDKGDAVLMDLNSRGVPGICRRADGFYGPPPHPPGSSPRGEPEPYQVLDYLPGVNLREYVRQRSDPAGAGAAGPGAVGGGRLDAVGTLDTLVRVLLALHHPSEPGASPVVHMDIKPSNVIVLPSGEARLIDFTGARYHRSGHITTIAYTREAGGPEAFSGTVGPAYDVHGFGAVAYYMITGTFPRTESPQQALAGAEPLPPWAVLRRHPLLEAHPTLRDHLLAPLADNPADRPGTEELTAWTARLADLVDRAGTPDVGLYWGVSRSARVVGRAGVKPGPVAATDDWSRVERLEQEVVELRAALSDSRDGRGGAALGGAAAGLAAGAALGSAGHGAAGAGGAAVPGRAGADRTTVGGDAGASAGSPDAGPMWPARATVRQQRGTAPTGADPTVRSAPVAAGGANGTRVMAGPGQTGRYQQGAATRAYPGGAPPYQGGNEPAPPYQGGGQPAHPEQQRRGVASVPQPAHRPYGEEPEQPPAEPEHDRLRPLPGARLHTLRRGIGLSITGALFAFVCWGVYAIANRDAKLANNFMMFVLVLVIAVGLFALCRLIGRLVIEGMMHRSRASARLSHLAVAAYLVAAGCGFAARVDWVSQAYHWVAGQL
ncbi:protein kinase domain-containing protein [Actinocatenispora thailandica]|uniref:protein kinase domain-containing protein n=1 Tax=Actinocatenispora thailandica TaxID=227318 RepID=UPI00194F1D07|nr:hypothetical protein [Actinocatenispora thailandica]